MSESRGARQPAPTERGESRTYHRLVALKRLLPEWLRWRLDPYNTEADRFVARAAAEIPAGARVLDAGAGECRHRSLFDHARYVGTDHALGESGAWDYSALCFRSDLAFLPLADDCLDAVISVNVLEHVSEPAHVLAECWRALRPGGRLYLVAPQAWRLHQPPHDYFRYTRYGLEHVLQKVGFKGVHVEAVGGAFWHFGTASLNLLTSFRGRAFPLAILLAPLLAFLVPLLCFYLDPLDRSRQDTLGYRVVAEKPL